jgi:hypothetical protein
MDLAEREEVTALSAVFLNGRQYIAVGTAIFPKDDDMDEFTHTDTALTAREGHVLIVEPRKDGDGWEIAVIVKADTVGAVHDVKAIHGFLAIASGSRVGHKLEARLTGRYPSTGWMRRLRLW